ncbi:MAG: hypothetical protein IJC27_01185 [Lentisphaeria bacterium]|nr:hypothetical protein [Lentisphaeria bacterium]
MKLEKLFFLSFLLCFLSVSSFAASVAYADGSLNTPLVYANDNSTPIKYPTAFKAEFDRKNLYITVKCNDPKALELGRTPRQIVRSWPMVDSVEIFLDPPQLKNFVQLAVGVNGMFYDSRKNVAAPAWKYELSFHSDFWQVKFIIPFSDLGVSAETGDNWKFNLCRNVRFSDNFNSTWAHVGSAFHNPSGFGTLTFGAPSAASAALKKKMRKAVAELEAELRKKGIYSELKDKVDAIRNNCTVSKINAIREEAQMIEQLKGL